MRALLFFIPVRGLFTLLAGLLAVALAPRASAAALLRENFDGASPWPALASTQSAAGGSVATTPLVTGVGTINTYLSGTRSLGLRLQVDSSAATGAWAAGVNSGLLPLLAANSVTNLGLLTLSFHLSVSGTWPVIVRIESFSGAAEGTRSGGLRTVIYPLAPDFDQRFAFELSSMTPDGAGTFNPAHSCVRLSFELASTAGPDIRIDNVNYSTPRFYVKPAALGGSDSANGQTEATAFATLQRAANLLTASGTDNIVVILEGGEYSGTNTGGDTVTLGKPGRPDAWIVFKNYPGHRPVVRTVGWQVFKLQNSNSTATTSSYVEIRGLTLRGQSFIAANGDRRINPLYEPNVGLATGSSNGNGIFVEGRLGSLAPRHFRYADNTVEFMPGAGIASADADRVSIENNLIRNNAWGEYLRRIGYQLSRYRGLRTGGQPAHDDQRQRRLRQRVHAALERRRHQLLRRQRHHHRQLQGHLHRPHRRHQQPRFQQRRLRHPRPQGRERRYRAQHRLP